LGLNPANKEYQLDDIAAMSDRRGYFERIGSEFEGSAVAEQPLAERLENAVYAAYYGDPNSRIDGIEAGVLSATGLGQSLADGIEALGQDPFSIIRDPVTLGYDQIQTAFYYTTGGLLGDPNSVLRNQGRTESFYDFVDAAKASTNDPEQAGYLFGGALLGLRRGGLPGAPNGSMPRPTQAMLDDPYHPGWLSYSGPRSTSADLVPFSGNLAKVNKPDAHADALAAKLGGQSRVRFENHNKEFDVISDEFIGEAKPANLTYGSSWRNQTRLVFEAAYQNQKKAYFHFQGGQPSRDILNKISEYSRRWNVEYVIDSTPLDY
jgi:hypothetical protein